MSDPHATGSSAVDRCPNTIHSNYVTDHRCQRERGHYGECLFGAQAIAYATPSSAAMFVSYTMSGPALPQGRLTLHMDAATEVRVQRLFKNRNVELTEAIVDAIALLAIPQEIRDA